MKKDLSPTCFETSKLVMLSFGANSFCKNISLDSSFFQIYALMKLWIMFSHSDKDDE